MANILFLKAEIKARVVQEKCPIDEFFTLSRPESNLECPFLEGNPSTN